MKKIGIDIGGTNIKLGLIDETNNIVMCNSIPTPINNIKALADLISQWLHKNVPQYKEMPIGISCAGTIHPKTKLLSADNLGFQDVPLEKILETALDCPVLIAQDAYSAMIAEWHYGNLKGTQNAVYLIIGTGIGGDAIVAGKPCREINVRSMEFGHMITHVGGHKCRCGEKGCYECYASARALVQSAPGYQSAKEIIDDVKEGNNDLLPIWLNYIEEVCIGIINLCRIFEPECLVIGGGISEAGSFLLNSISDCLQRHPFWNTCSTVIKLGALGNYAGVIGAAEIAYRNSF